MKTQTIRQHARRASRVIITTRRRSATGFKVTGPDGQQYHARTHAEALSNLAARVQCFDVAPWRVDVA